MNVVLDCGCLYAAMFSLHSAVLLLGKVTKKKELHAVTTAFQRHNRPVARIASGEEAKRQGDEGRWRQSGMNGTMRGATTQTLLLDGYVFACDVIQRSLP